MDREKIKAARRDADAAQETKVSDVFPQPEGVTIGGREYVIRPLSFRDVRDCEAEYGSFAVFLGEIASEKVSASAFYLWLHLRGSDDRLSMDDAVPLFLANPTEASEALTACLRADKALFPNAPGAEDAEPTPQAEESTGGESSAN